MFSYIGRSICFSTELAPMARPAGNRCGSIWGNHIFVTAAQTTEDDIVKAGIVTANKPVKFLVIAIVRMVNKEFLWMIAVANVVAWPAVYYCANKFLQNYTYQIPVDIWTFAAAGFLSFVIAVLTISVHTVKAGIQNPVDAIRYE